MINNRLVMELGEKRKIYIKVYSKKNDVFILQSAKVSLYRLKNNVLEKESECVSSIEDTNVYTEIKPQNSGYYLLKVIMEIADEHIIKKFNLVVND